MSLRRRTRKKAEPEEYALDTFSQAWGSTTQWKNAAPHAVQQQGGQADGTHPGHLAESSPSARSLPTRTFDRSILNKPLPPLPPEALSLRPPEKSPLRPEPSLAHHPAFQRHPEIPIAPEQMLQEMRLAQLLTPQNQTIQPGLPDLAQSSRHSSTSSEWPVKRRNILGFGRRRHNPVSELGIELKVQQLMLDRGTQTTPSLNPPLADKTPDTKHKDAGTSRSNSLKSRLKRRASSEESGRKLKRRPSSEEGGKTPIWSPRAILKIGNPVDYFCLAFAEDVPEDEDAVRGQISNYIRQIKRATPPSPFSRRRAGQVTNKSSSTDSVGTYESRYDPAPTRPGILRRAISDDPNLTTRKSLRFDIDDPSQHLREPASASAVLTTPSKAHKTPPETPTTFSRPLPLPLQKLTSRSSTSSFRRRQSKSDPGLPAPISPLRQELRHDKTPSPPSTSELLPTSFKINRPRALKLPLKDQDFPTGRHVPPTPEEEKEAADLFIYRSPYFVGTPDQFDTPRLVEQNVPEHLAGSPLCPMHPKHKTGGWGVCPYHGRRASLPDEILSLVESDVSQDSADSMVRRTSTITSEVKSIRRVSADSDDDWDERRRSSALDESGDDARRYGHNNKPTLGRQDSWNAAVNDGAVRGFGFQSPPPEAPSTPMPMTTTPGVPTPDSMPTPGPPRRTPAILGAPTKHERPDADSASTRSVYSSEAHAHSTEFTHSSSPYLPVDELRILASRSRASGKAKKEGVINRGGRVGMMMDSSDSVYRLQLT